MIFVGPTNQRVQAQAKRRLAVQGISRAWTAWVVLEPKGSDLLSFDGAFGTPSNTTHLEKTEITDKTLLFKTVLTRWPFLFIYFCVSSYPFYLGQIERVPVPTDNSTEPATGQDGSAESPAVEEAEDLQRDFHREVH